MRGQLALPSPTRLFHRMAADPTVTRLVERFIFIDVVSFDWNCQQYIPPCYTLEEIERLLAAAVAGN